METVAETAKPISAGVGAGFDSESGDGLEGVRVSVVIPARNEAANLPTVLASLPEDVFEIVLVDGGSTDGTAEVAQSCRADVRVLEQEGSGKGDALLQGFAAARGNIIVMFDGDGSAKGDEIPHFVHALKDGADLAKGSRFTGGGGSADITFARRLGNRFFRTIVNMLFGTRYTGPLLWLQRDLDAVAPPSLARVRRVRVRGAPEHPRCPSRPRRARGAELRGSPDPRNEQPQRCPGRVSDLVGDRQGAAHSERSVAAAGGA